jgi:hypothetical protein
VAHTCNPSYSEGRDLEDHGSEPAQAKEFSKPYLEKNPSQKKAGVDPEFKPQYRNKQQKKTAIKSKLWVYQSALAV